MNALIVCIYNTFLNNLTQETMNRRSMLPRTEAELLKGERSTCGPGKVGLIRYSLVGDCKKEEGKGINGIIFSCLSLQSPQSYVLLHKIR